MDISLGVVATGVISSGLTELFKFVPFLSKNSLTKALTAIVVVAVVSFVTNGLTWSLENAIGTLVFSFGTYKAFIEPVRDSLSD